jgi:glycosyltransferase involved in cell wall biosynthesis
LTASPDGKPSTTPDMKIGIDIRAAIEEPAGIGKVVGNMTRELLALDAANDYVLYANSPFELPVRNPRARVAVMNLAKFPGGRLLWHIATTFRARYVDRVDRFISVASLQTAALTKDLVVLVVPDLTNVLFPEWHVAKPKLTGRLFLRRALKNARHVVAISENTRKDILAYAEIPESKVSVAWISCDEEFQRPVAPERVTQVREKYSFTKYILSVGTIEPRKNYPALIEAFAGVAREMKEVELVIAGRKGWKWEETFDVAGRSSAGRRIRFLDYVPPEDLPALYAGAEIFVYPSFYEGFGIPPLEAMAVGIPVITSNTSSLPEVVGEAALQVGPADMDALRNTMLELLRDQGLRQRLSGAGRTQAARFSWESFGRSILEVIQSR